MRISVTGAGIVSAVGTGLEDTLRSLRELRSGVGAVRYLETAHPEFPVAEVKMNEEELRRELGINPSETTTRTAMLSMLALREALDRAGNPPIDAIISGTTVGGMEKSEAFYRDFISESMAHTDYIRIHDCGSSTMLAAKYIGGVRTFTTLSTACSSAANAIITGANMILSGKARRVAAGGSECLSDFHLAGFASLMILDRERCRPFDVNRAGLNLGEGAAYIIMEADAPSPFCLSGWGNACDAFHQTATSENGEGAFLAMEKAIRKAGLKPSDIDYVNAHGTGTSNNDASESAALRRIFGDSVPPVSSTKAFTGHTTSAAGGIEAVISLLSLREGFIPASLGFSEEDPSCIVPSGGENRPLRHVLSNSFGFGGNDTSLVFSAL